MNELAKTIFRNLSPFEARRIATKGDDTIVPWLSAKLDMGLTDSQVDALACIISDKVVSWGSGKDLASYRANLLANN